jgi:dolichyl-phosphate-mannose-protein mannosyltransferase
MPPGSRPPAPPAPDRDRLERALLPAVLLVAIAARLALLPTSGGLTMDSPLYVRMSERLAAGAAAPGPAHHGYPGLVALAGWVVPGREWPGRVVSLLAGVAVTWLVYRLARIGLSRRWATLPAALVALHPLLVVYSGAVMTESSFLALALGGLLLVERGRVLAAGALLGAAYLVRPEALVIAPVAALLGPPRGAGGSARSAPRRALLLALGLACLLLPYLGYLRWERGEWMLSPKTVLVHPGFASRAEAEWRVGGALGPGAEPPRNLLQRVLWSAPSVAARYLPGLDRHLGRLVEAWPIPLLALSGIGLLVRRGAAAAPLAVLLLLPALAVPFDLRFAQLFVPSLAVLAAAGASWLAHRWPARARLVGTIAVAVALAGLARSWALPSGVHALHFDDGPMPQMRVAGEWLRTHGRTGATVMDRKAYVPFFAGMTHVQLPDDDYDTIIEYARRTGVDYLVIEEFTAATLRPQLRSLLADAAFRARERRLRPLFAVRDEPLTGVAVFEVVRDSAGAGH